MHLTKETRIAFNRFLSNNDFGAMPEKLPTQIHFSLNTRELCCFCYYQPGWLRKQTPLRIADPSLLLPLSLPSAHLSYSTWWIRKHWMYMREEPQPPVCWTPLCWWDWKGWNFLGNSWGSLVKLKGFPKGISGLGMYPYKSIKMFIWYTFAIWKSWKWAKCSSSERRKRRHSFIPIPLSYIQ